MDFFLTTKPYEIANQVTNNHELSGDLVSFVYLLMKERNDIEDEKRFFARCAYQQWYWSNSEFNREYKSTGDYELTDEVEEDDVVEEDNEYRAMLWNYLYRDTDDPAEWYKNEVIKMIIKGETHREISNKTGINHRYITDVKKQFKNDILNYYNIGSDSDDTTGV